MAHERLHASWRAAPQPTLSHVLMLKQQPPSHDMRMERPCASGWRGVRVDAQLKPSRLLWYSTDVRPAGHGPRAPPRRMPRSTTAHGAIFARALTASTQPRSMGQAAVSSSLARRARGCAAEATTLAAVLRQCQAGRAWPASDSTPHGSQHDSPRCHLGSCSGSIHPAPTRASRSREHQLGEACLWTRS